MRSSGSAIASIVLPGRCGLGTSSASDRRVLCPRRIPPPCHSSRTSRSEAVKVGTASQLSLHPHVHPGGTEQRHLGGHRERLGQLEAGTLRAATVASVALLAL